MAADDIIRSYLSFVDFLAEIAGAHSEVVLHDLRDKEHSLVAIRNGHLSGREAGAPLTDFALKMLTHAQKDGKQFMTNYLGKAGTDGKFLKSSTFFIRDDSGEIIAMLGINSDLSAFKDFYNLLGRFMSINEMESQDVDVNQDPDFEPSIKEMVYSVIDQVIASCGIDASRMTTEEKKKIVDELDEKGVFLLRGTIPEVAQRLDVSEQTIYRYLR